MTVKKAGGRIFGATFTAAEKKALDIEIQREVKEVNEKNLLEIDALILYILHTKYGFGVKRLKDFFNSFGEAFDALNERYELPPGSEVWMATKKMEEYGVDLKAWEQERLEKIQAKSAPTFV